MAKKAYFKSDDRVCIKKNFYSCPHPLYAPHDRYFPLFPKDSFSIQSSCFRRCCCFGQYLFFNSTARHSTTLKFHLPFFYFLLLSHCHMLVFIHFNDQEDVKEFLDQQTMGLRPVILLHYFLHEINWQQL